jgi:hypothetical protein
MTTTPQYTDYTYEVTKLIRVVAGNTYDLTLRMDCGFYVRPEWAVRVRLLPVDTWEMWEPGGPAAQADALFWISEAVDAGRLMGCTFKTNNFGGWGIVLWRTDTREHLADFLTANGHCKPAKPDKKAA